MVVQNLVQTSNLFNYTSFSYFFFLFGFSYLNKLKKWSLVNSWLFESSRKFKTTSRIKTTSTILITQYKTMTYSSSVTQHNFFHEFFFLVNLVMWRCSLKIQFSEFFKRFSGKHLQWRQLFVKLHPRPTTLLKMSLL